MIRMTIIVRALRGKEGTLQGAKDESRSLMVGFGRGAKKAIEKSRVEVGEDGVTMIAGKDDFSSTRGRERSRGAGIKV